jgi:hypothetical protein
MNTERIEIFPGHWIEVTPAIKKKAGVRKSQRVVATLMGETVAAAGRLVRDGNRGVKYPVLMLDEAVSIAEREGLKKAVKVTGIKEHSIDLRSRQLRRKQGKTKVRAVGSRYTLAQKQACVRLAKELMASNEIKERSRLSTLPHCKGMPYVHRRYKWSHRSAFIEAGRRLGMNGRSIEWMYVQGTIPLTQQPSGA